MILYYKTLCVTIYKTLVFVKSRYIGRKSVKVDFADNQKTRFTRMCIGEAVVKLLKQKDFGSLKISDIVRKAGVSRTTFYQYYTTPYSVLTDYLSILVSEYLQQSKLQNPKRQFFTYAHILFSLQFFDGYADFFLTLSENKLHSVMLDGINTFMTQHIRTDSRLSVYELYSYAGGLLNTFLKWEEDGKKDTAEEIANTIYRMYVRQAREIATEPV